MASDNRSIISSLRRSSRASSAVDTIAAKQEAIAKGVFNLFAARTEQQQLTDRELRETIQRAFRERRRLVSGLSGKFLY
jgi:hypothetical protein